MPPERMPQPISDADHNGMPNWCSARMRRAAMLAGATVTVGVALVGSAPAPATADIVSSALISTGNQVLQSYMTQSSASDPRYYANGVWYATDGPSCWYCYDSAAVGAATLSQQPDGSAQLEQVAIDTFNTAIAQHQLPSGAFDDDTGAADGIGTGFFTVDLGLAYLELKSTLDPQTAARWSAAIGAAADYLINSGNTTWYVNGNVNLRQTEVMWLAWVATGQQRFLTAYDSEWLFTISPDQARWPGFGLHITRTPTQADGSDGAGYLAESGGGAPGFDPSYTDAQLDTATDLYVLTHDPKYLRLMNLLFNQLQPLIDPTWTLDALNGTRKDDLEPFLDPAVSVLVANGDRPDLASGLPAQMSRLQREYLGAETFTNENYYKGFGSWISMPLLNVQWPAGMAPDTRVVSEPPPPNSSTPSPPTSSVPPSIPVTVDTPGQSLGGAGGTVDAASGTRQNRASANAAAVDLRVTRPAGNVLPGITLLNAPLGDKVAVSVTAHSVVTGKHGRKHMTAFVRLRTITVKVSKPRMVVRLELTKAQLRTLAPRRWTFLIDVRVTRGRVVRRLNTVLHAVSLVPSRS